MSIAATATENMIRFYEESILKDYDHGMGSLRCADIMRRVTYMAKNSQQIFGSPATPEDGDEIVLTAIAQSYGAAAARETGWDCRAAIRIAYAVLEEANCHDEAAALRQMAEKTGAW